MTWQLRQADHLTGFGIDIDFVITGPAGKSGHGAHFAQKRVDEPCTHAGANFTHGNHKPGRRPFESRVMAEA